MCRNSTDADKPFTNDSQPFRFYDVQTDDELRELVSDAWVAEQIKNMDIEQKGTEWHLEKEFAEDDVKAKVWSRALFGEELRAYKVTIRSSAKLSDLVQLLHTEMTERHGEWNATYTKGKVLHKLDDDTNVQFWAYNPGALLKRRDFVVVRRRVTNSDGSVILCDRSVSSGLRPESSKFVVLIFLGSLLG